MKNSLELLVNRAEPLLPVPHPISHRRKIGAYYTPIAVTSLLCQWGIRSGADVVLEPCFGGCTFVEAAFDVLKEKGCLDPSKNVFGFDIDPLAFKYLNSRLGAEIRSENFVAGDFLEQRSKPDQLMDLVIGNPPYIRHNNFNADQKATVGEWMVKNEVKLNGRSSLWAYFILHGMNFLKAGGRAAWVLPGSFLSAKYSKEVRRLIASNFQSVTAITLTERIFKTEGTEEITVILLAEGYSKAPLNTTFDFICLDSIDELSAYLQREQTQQAASRAAIGYGMIPDKSMCALLALAEDVQSKSFGSVAEIQIGVVTGNTKFFIKPMSEWKKLGIDKRHLQYILPRSLWLKGIRVTKDDSAAHVSSDIRCLALDSPKRPRATSLKSYLSTYSESDIKTNSTFARRSPWFSFLDNQIPHAFLVFMTDAGPRLVINEASANCTNSLYRVTLKDEAHVDIKIVAISLCSTFSQLSAESLGHGRGSGALKLEPSDAAKISLFLPPKDPASIHKAFVAIDELVKLHRYKEAREYSDAYLFNLPEFKEPLQLMNEGLEIARSRRMRPNYREGT